MNTTTDPDVKREETTVSIQNNMNNTRANNSAFIITNYLYLVVFLTLL
jgi:hypothetical protein